MPCGSPDVKLGIQTPKLVAHTIHFWIWMPTPHQLKSESRTSLCLSWLVLVASQPWQAWEISWLPWNFQQNGTQTSNKQGGFAQDMYTNNCSIPTTLKVKKGEGGRSNEIFTWRNVNLDFSRCSTIFQLIVQNLSTKQTKHYYINIAILKLFTIFLEGVTWMTLSALWEIKVFRFCWEYGRKAETYRNWPKGTTRSGACGLIWLNTEGLARSRHCKDWQIDSSFLIGDAWPLVVGGVICLVVHNYTYRIYIDVFEVIGKHYQYSF